MKLWQIQGLLLGLVEILTDSHLCVVLIGHKHIVVTDNSTRCAWAIFVDGGFNESFPTVRRGLMSQGDTGIRRSCEHAFSAKCSIGAAGDMILLHLLNQCEDVLTGLDSGIKQLSQRVCSVELHIGVLLELAFRGTIISYSTELEKSREIFAKVKFLEISKFAKIVSRWVKEFVDISILQK